MFSLIKGLDRDLFDPRACVFRRETDYLEREGFPCPVFCPEIMSFFSPSTYARFLKLRDYIRKERIDVVQTVFNDSALALPFYTLGSGAKVVSTRRDTGFWYTPAKLRILRMNSLLTDRYLVNSRAVRESVRKSEWVPDRKIVVIPNGYDLSRFDAPPLEAFHETYGIPAGSPVVGIVANLRPVKRVGDLITAFSLVVKEVPDSYLMVVGHTGEQPGTYLDLARSLGIGGRVRFAGLIPDPIPIIRHFSVGVNCSESEGLSNAVIEYMGCGVPVVATGTEGNRELVDHGETGLLVPVGDTRALAESIVRLLREGPLREMVSVRARETVLKRHDANEVMKRYERFYFGIARDGRNGRDFGNGGPKGQEGCIPAA